MKDVKDSQPDIWPTAENRPMEKLDVAALEEGLLKCRAHCNSLCVLIQCGCGTMKTESGTNTCE